MDGEQSSLATSEPGTRVPAGNPRRRIIGLVVAHVVGGWLLAALVAWAGPTGFSLLEAVVIGVVFAQAGLLAIWCGFGLSPWWGRLLGAVAGAGYFGLLLTVCARGPRAGNFVIVFSVLVLEATGFLVLRCFRIRICRAPEQESPVRRVQFAIRDLMLLTLAVACFVTLAKWIAPSLTGLPPLFELSLLVLVLAVVGLLSVWPVLGARQPLPASAISLVVSAGVGFCVVWSFLHDLEGAALWAVLTATEALLLAVSLFLVRSCGYRLVRLPPPGAVTASGESPFLPSEPS
jgi:hypothetical protein